MITITADFDFKDLDTIINSDVQHWLDDLGTSLFEAGKKIIDVQIAKPKGPPFSGEGFGNITYNLRSSMGVGLVVKKVVKQDYFPFGKGDVGQTHGRELLKTVASETTEEICLVVVAGEYYGVFVQSKGYDVIKMAEGTLPPEFLKELQNG
ncbi:hypothetical protein ACJVDH_00385 [Pedobacter sp. AW1-32]|uniref:hypothetical protein n=1 Tax=Pedobacter sp. AW1-32 TaxID=3383026 RepID=UPI003FEE7B2C